MPADERRAAWERWYSEQSDSLCDMIDESLFHDEYVAAFSAGYDAGRASRNAEIQVLLYAIECNWNVTLASVEASRGR